MKPIVTIDQLIQEMDTTIATEQQERTRLNKLVRLIERFADGVSDEFLSQFEQGTQGYSRHLLHADPQDRFSMLCLVWKPGQGTPIHDHPSWGVLGVLRGRMRFTNYAPDEQQGQHCLVPVETFIGTAGSVGTVYPPAMDLHRMDNCSGDEMAITLHAYGCMVKEFHIYNAETGERREATGEFDSILEGAYPQMD
ncbi:MAG: cysteine dioxygenase family protein [Planctomycetota bacterium]|nr:cysteine dioxygenase family protein [Planctomycetota bacterium]